jgi:PAS domain S-box-containing protein
MRTSPTPALRAKLFDPCGVHREVAGESHMASPPEMDLLRQQATPDWDSQEHAAARGAPLSPFFPDRRWLVASIGWLLLHVSHPVAWLGTHPTLWDPSIGAGIVVLAWLGPRALALVAAASLSSILQANFLNLGIPGGSGWAVLVNVFVHMAVDVAQVQGIWWCYRTLCGGSWGIADFRSAVVFVISVAIVCFLGAFPLSAAARLNNLPHDFSWSFVGHIAMARALGALTLAPPLLFVTTQRLFSVARLRKTSESANSSNMRPSQRGGTQWTARQWAQWGLVCAIAVVLGTVGFRSIDIQAVDGFGVDAMQLLWVELPWLLVGLISLCFGAQRGLLVAAATVLVPLCLKTSNVEVTPSFLELQGLLLTPWLVVLLAGLVTASMMQKETPYRDVVSRLPVVLYNARVTAGGEDGRPPSAEVFFVSPACTEVLGQFPEDLLGDHFYWLRHIHPEDREIVIASLAQLGRQHQPVVCEYRLAPTIAVQTRPVSFLITAWSRVIGSHGSRIFSSQQPQPTGRWLRDTLVPQLDRLGRLVGWQGVVTDITEQRHLADDLRQTTSMLHALVANLPAGVFFMQAPSGRPILVNARARQLLGQREDPAVGLDRLVDAYRLHRPDGTPFPVEEMPVTTALRRGTPTMRDDIVVHRPDGRRLPLITWAAPIDLAGKGEPDAVVWVFEDLTALQQAENARRQSEAYLRTVVSTMAEALVVQDHTGKVVECNPSGGTLFGVDVDRLKGRSLLAPEWSYLKENGEPLPPEGHPVRRVLTTGKPVHNDVIAVKLPPKCAGLDQAAVAEATSAHDTSLRWLLVNATPLFSTSEGQPANVVTTFTDITAYRHAQEVLRTSEEKYRGLVETLPLMLCQLDRGGRFTYVNPAVKVVTGYDLDDLREPEFWQSLIHPEDRERVLAAQRDSLAGQTVKFEFRYRANDGTERIAYTIGQPQWHNDEVIGTISLVVDMTRERRLEQDLQRAQRLELIGRLSSGIAHDFNNLLTVILTLTDLARTSLPPDHITQEELQRIATAGRQAANLAHQLLGFSKQKPMTARPFDLNRVARRTLDLLRATWPPSITIQTALATDLPTLEGDEWQLQQVLMNLCLNAHDAMPNGGTLRVCTQPAKAPADSPSGNVEEVTINAVVSEPEWLLLSVQDGGAGMSEEVQARIFDPFFTTKELGSGLGLAVVQRIIATHGGRIDVRSKLGEGTRFDVWLPLKQSTNGGLSAKSPA